MKTPIVEKLAARRAAFQQERGDGYSMSQIARNIGVAPRTLMNWEAGIHTPSTLGLLQKYANEVDARLVIKVKE